VIRWLFRLVLTLLAARVWMSLSQGSRGRFQPPTQPFHPGGGSTRAKTPGVEALSPHPIEDADYEELPRSSV
jgi:hypothetical protein